MFSGCGKTSMLMALLGRSKLVPRVYFHLIQTCRGNALHAFAHRIVVQPTSLRRRGICSARIMGAKCHYTGEYLIRDPVRRRTLSKRFTDSMLMLNLFNINSYWLARYLLVLQQCALEPDLELFEAGDQTEVGERGLTLRQVFFYAEETDTLLSFVV